VSADTAHSQTYGAAIPIDLDRKGDEIGLRFLHSVACVVNSPSFWCTLSAIHASSALIALKGKIEGFASPNLPQNDTIRAVAEGRL
jgi:hypothetical protein